jgi:hypothetical protein
MASSRQRRTRAMLASAFSGIPPLSDKNKPHLHAFVGHLGDKHNRDQLTSPIRSTTHYYALVQLREG